MPDQWCVGVIGNSVDAANCNVRRTLFVPGPGQGILFDIVSLSLELELTWNWGPGTVLIIGPRTEPHHSSNITQQPYFFISVWIKDGELRSHGTTVPFILAGLAAVR